MYKQISSLQNPLIKEVLQLQEKSRIRRSSGLFIIEGLREIELALKGNYVLKSILYCTDIISTDEFKRLKEGTNSETEFIELSSEVYQKLAYRTTTEGVISIAKAKSLSLYSIQLGNNPLILVAEAPEKPGNIGAILRTADAANIDAVIIANPKTDIYNPNIIRSSVGAIFTNQIATGSTSEIIAYLEEKKVAIFSAILQDAVEYHRCDYTGASAIIVGTEAEGLSEEWRIRSSQNITIPMQGHIDSINVSVAAGILIFEAKRQRIFK